MDISQFIDNVVAGNAAAAKENLNDILSARAFEAIDGQKKELAKSLFGGNSGESEVEVQNTEEVTDDEEAYAEEVEHDGEQLDELSKSTLDSYYKKAHDSYQAAAEHKARHKPMTYSSPSPSNWDHTMYLDKERTKAAKTMEKRKKGVERIINRRGYA